MNSQVTRFHNPGSGGSVTPCRHFGMKTLTASIVLLFLIADVADSREFKVKSNAGAYRVEVTLNRYPLVLGDNRMEIEIRDASDQCISDAKVLVNYYMPPMPRMVPMNYKTEADSENGQYEAKVNIIMPGPWYIKLIIGQGGKVSTAKFNVDAQ
jgi:hypothetical protein